MKKLPPLRDPNSRHFRALGQFIYRCSEIEASLAEMLRQLSGIENEQIARAVMGVGDLRVSDYITIAKRLVAITQVKTEKLSHLLLWVTYFNDVRNVVAHKPFYVRGDLMAFSNTWTAKTRESRWMYECTQQALRNAAAIADEVALSLMFIPEETNKPDW